MGGTAGAAAATLGDSSATVRRNGCPSFRSARSTELAARPGLGCRAADLLGMWGQEGMTACICVGCSMRSVSLTSSSGSVSSLSRRLSRPHTAPAARTRRRDHDGLGPQAPFSSSLRVRRDPRFHRYAPRDVGRGHEYGRRDPKPGAGGDLHCRIRVLRLGEDGGRHDLNGPADVRARSSALECGTKFGVVESSRRPRRGQSSLQG